MTFYDARVGKLYMAQYDLTGYTTDMTSTAERSLSDVTVLGDTTTKWLPGRSQDKFNWAGLFDDGASGSDVILNAMRSATSKQVISVFPADTVVGNQGLASDEVFITGYDLPASVGNAVTATAAFEAGLYDRVKSLGPLATTTATANGTSINDSATGATTDGGAWTYHITGVAVSGGNARWQLILQDSANNSSFATVSSESVNITGVGATRRTFTGTLRQYVRIRAVLDASSGSLTYIAMYQRD